MISVDRAIGISVGVGVSLLSFSGLMCINCQDQCNSTETNKCPKNKKCSRANMNLGLGSFGLAGGLMIYKNVLGK